MSFGSPRKLVQNRFIDAKAVLAGQADFRAYPYKHLLVVVRNAWSGSALTVLMAAVEHLSNYGWEMVNFTTGGAGETLYAAMRRTVGPTPR
ncbi:hypothetical protein ACL02O_00805 [Micromonospora sp. MS34]|uniref:hypothetical protein n=1 Tax=Micromonospora sp. MS34 TaxID=3385971 RepID=UPI0039A09A58